MSLWADFADDVRAGIRPVAKWSALTMIVFGVLFFVVIGIAYFVFQRDSSAVAPDDVPLEPVAPAVVDTFTCIEAGPDGCPSYTESTEWVIAATPKDGLLYTPLHDDDPGSPAEGGQVQFVASKDTTPEQWHALAAAVTREGRANASTVTEDSVRDVPNDPQAVEYTLSADGADPAVTGTLEFTVSDSGPLLRSVAYAEAG